MAPPIPSGAAASRFASDGVLHMAHDLPRGHTRFVLAVLAREGSFITAHGLYLRVHHLGRPMGISTVYRALRELVQRDLVDVMVEDRNERWYRHCSGQPHHHLVCSYCHSTIEIPAHSQPLPAWTAEEALGFTDVLVRVTVTGTCAECTQARSRCG